LTLVSLAGQASEGEVNLTIGRLVEYGLITKVTASPIRLSVPSWPDPAASEVVLDAHPLVREYFATTLTYKHDAQASEPHQTPRLTGLRCVLVSGSYFGIARSEPASGLRRQPELCQQAAEVTTSPLRTPWQSLPVHAAWFRRRKETQQHRGYWRLPHYYHIRLKLSATHCN